MTGQSGKPDKIRFLFNFNSLAIIADATRELTLAILKCRLAGSYPAGTWVRYCTHGLGIGRPLRNDQYRGECTSNF